MTTTSWKGDRWALAAKQRTGSDFELVASVFLMQRCMVSEGLRKRYNLSKTLLRTTVEAQDKWIRARLTRVNVVEVVLEKHKLLGWLVWRLYDRLMVRMKKAVTMRSGPPAPPPGQPDQAEGEKDGAAHATDEKTVPPAQPA